MTIPDAERVRSALSASALSQLEGIDCFDEIDSTNTWLMQQVPPRLGCLRIAVSDHQMSGRGRHDRRWMSAPGSSLCLSVAYTFEQPPSSLPPLTLAVGVAVASALSDIGVTDVMLKWPNDLLVQDSKLGGILTESRIGNTKDVTVVTGVGINLQLPPELAASIRTDWVYGPIGLDSFDLHAVDRDGLAAAIVNSLHDAFRIYATDGIKAFESRFESIDWLRGRDVEVNSADASVCGTAAGIADDGALLLNGTDGVRRVIAGSVRLARKPGPATQTQ